MAEENTTANDAEPKVEDHKDDFAEALAAIERNVTEKLDKGLSSIKDKLEKPEPQDEEWVDDGEEDQPITKKELAEILRKKERESETRYETRTRKQIRDAQIIQDFPEMNKNSPAFSRKMFDEVGKELDLRMKRGKSPEDPDLLYDATAAVAARGVREGWYQPKAQIHRENVRRNSRDDSFEITDSGGSTSTEPNEAQVRLASRVGLTKEKLAQHLGKIAKR